MQHFFTWLRWIHTLCIPQKDNIQDSHKHLIVKATFPLHFMHGKKKMSLLTKRMEVKLPDNSNKKDSINLLDEAPGLSSPHC